MLITFEGIEGSGKSTLIATLASDLRERGVPVLVTREPGGTPLGDAVRTIFLDPRIRIDPLTEALLINAARAQHVSEVIGPALKAGRIVLCDRFFDATIAYQGFGRGLDVELLLELCLIATQRIAPDLTFVLDVTPEISAARVAERGASDRLEREGIGFHHRVREGYLQLAERFGRMHVIDATQSPESVAAAALIELEVRRVRHASTL
ncbi:MAG: dTMP kinase [Candidatus Velthaea sp.]